MGNENGGFIGAKRVVTSASAASKSGVWSISSVQREVGANTWKLGYRYLRYVVGSPTASHHPRFARIILTVDGVDTNVTVATSDNCADSGTVPTEGTAYVLDLGAGNGGYPTAAKIYSTYGGGTRGSNYSVSGSPDNSTWTALFNGNMTSSACGIITGTIV